jgi:glutaredoxin 3
MITVYSADWCAYCHAVKQYFDGLGIKYEEKNVEKEPKYAEEAVKKSGQMGIPVIDIDGTIIVGFNRPTIDATILAKNVKK